MDQRQGVSTFDILLNKQGAECGEDMWIFGILYLSECISFTIKYIAGVHLRDTSLALLGLRIKEEPLVSFFVGVDKPFPFSCSANITVYILYSWRVQT